MRVGLAIETTGPGGAETMLLGLAEELRRGGHEVLAIVPTGGEGWLADQFRHRGFALEQLEFRRSVDPTSVRRLVHIIRRHRLDVLHSHEFALAVYGGLAARLASCPHVITMHGGLYFSERRRRRIALRVAIAWSRAAVAVSDFSREVIARRMSLTVDDLVVVHNGVEPLQGSGSAVRRELGAGEGDVLILAVGNLYPVKGHRFLLEAVAGLEEGTQSIVALAGRGGEQDALSDLARERGIAHRVRFLGFRTDVADLLAAADIFVMPSLSEGLPMALIEAMFAARAIVASRVGGIPELLVDELHGLLVPAEDPAAVTAALRRLTTDGALRGRLGAEARARAERDFTLRAMTTKYLDLYRDGGTAAAATHE